MESESVGMASSASGLAAFKSVCLIGGSTVYGAAQWHSVFAHTKVITKLITVQPATHTIFAET